MADISNFATKDNADEGVIFPVRIKGTKIPLAIKIFGSDSDLVRDYEMNKIRNLGIGKNGKKQLDADDVEELLANADEDILIRIGGLYAYDWDKGETVDEPVILFDKTLENDKKSYAFLINKIPAIKEFVTEKSNERSNFLSVGKKN